MQVSETRIAAPSPADAKAYLLRLYVAGQTPKSVLALANLKQICEEHLRERYEIEVIDLLESPQLAQGDQILVQAVQNALLSSYTLYSEHQAYVSYAPASQLLARFDQVATKGNKTWALNYGTMADTFTGMQNITPVFYVLELVNRTSDNLLFDVESFINQTK